MNELALTRDLRLRLKADAHHLEPVVLLGAQGLTDAVVKEIDRALNAHALIKVRVPGSERAQLEQIFVQVAGRLGAARVQLIGRLMVLFRPLPPTPTAAPQRPRLGAAEKPKRPRPGAVRAPARSKAPPQKAPGRGGFGVKRAATKAQEPRQALAQRAGFGAKRTPARRTPASAAAAKPARARASQRPPLKRT